MRITRAKKPWITDNIKIMQRLRNNAKARYKRTRLSAHWNYYKQLRNYLTFAIRSERKPYFEYLHARHNGSRLWSEIKKLRITPNRRRSVPAHLSNVDDINNAFMNDIPDVHTDFHTLSSYRQFVRDDVDPFRFETVVCDVVMKHLLSIKSNAVGADEIGLNLLQLITPYALPYLTHIINSCIETNYYPRLWKLAVVLPLPKSNSVSEFRDLRPISILPAISKVLERIMYEQLRNHLDTYKLIPDCQSGFRRGFSCSTALLKVTDDVIEARDKGKLSLLVLLDFSKAFDTINHSMLLAILYHLGCSSEALKFMESYVSQRYQLVRLSNCDSAPLPIGRGVPQGSILGPLLFSAYTSFLPRCVKFCDVQLYADDTQIYISFPPGDSLDAINKINHDLNAIGAFADSHSLILNPIKTKAVLFGREKDVDEHLHGMTISLNGTGIAIMPEAKNLGLIVDNSFRYRKHINNTIGKAYNNLKLLYPFKSTFSKKLKKVLCESFILSLFTYACVVYGPCLDALDASRVQRVQNACMRYIFQIRKYDSISYKLKELGWLSMHNRVVFHSLILFHSIICGRSPPYLYNKIRYRCDIHNINVRNKNLITPPIHNTALYTRSFSYNIYALYNPLSNCIKARSVSAFRCAIYLLLFSRQ